MLAILALRGRAVLADDVLSSIELLGGTLAPCELAVSRGNLILRGVGVLPGRLDLHASAFGSSLRFAGGDLVRVGDRLPRVLSALTGRPADRTSLALMCGALAAPLAAPDSAPGRRLGDELQAALGVRGTPNLEDASTPYPPTSIALATKPSLL